MVMISLAWGVTFVGTWDDNDTLRDILFEEIEVDPMKHRFEE